MAVFLFTGCGKKKTEKDTTLEGTWRMTKIIEEYYRYDKNGNLHEEESNQEEKVYPSVKPLDEDDEEIGLSMVVQPYIQFKNNKASNYYYIKLNIPEEYKSAYEDFASNYSNYPIYDLLLDVLDGVVFKEYEDEYSSTGKNIVITGIRYNEDTDEEYTVKVEYSYVIEGKQLVLTGEYISEYEIIDDELYVDKCKTTAYFEKVKDSVVDNAIDIDEIDIDESELPSLDF